MKFLHLCGLLLLGHLVVQATPAPPEVHIGGLGTFSIEDGETSARMNLIGDAIASRGLMVHYGFGLDRRLSSYTRLHHSAGLGIMVRYGLLSLPVWLGPGLTLTALWGHRLKRPFLGGGTGLRYHLGKNLAVAVAWEAAWYENSIWDQHLQTGLLFVWNRHATKVN